MDKLQVDIHRLDRRYGHIRVRKEAEVRRLADSINRHGQLEALLTVTANENGLVLIDGYQRLKALEYLGRDRALVQVDDLNEAEALCQMLTRGGERRWELIEEAGLIQELRHRFGYSLGDIGNRIGRDKSFVKRRLDLLESLPEAVLKHILSGVITGWGASRVLAPLARANAGDAERLATSLAREPLSTRELVLFYDHYRKANRQVRERMLEAPALFVKSLSAATGPSDASPEEKWLRDAKATCGILHRLRDRANTVLYRNQEKVLRRQLLVQVARARRLMAELHQRVKERIKDA